MFISGLAAATDRRHEQVFHLHKLLRINLLKLTHSTIIASKAVCALPVISLMMSWPQSADDESDGHLVALVVEQIFKCVLVTPSGGVYSSNRRLLSHRRPRYSAFYFRARWASNRANSGWADVPDCLDRSVFRETTAETKRFNCFSRDIADVLSSHIVYAVHRRNPSVTPIRLWSNQ